MTANQPPETPPNATHAQETFVGKSRNAASSVKLALRALDNEPVRTLGWGDIPIVLDPTVPPGSWEIRFLARSDEVPS